MSLEKFFELAYILIGQTQKCCKHIFEVSTRTFPRIFNLTVSQAHAREITNKNQKLKEPEGDLPL